MPLPKFQSLCELHQKKIVSKDRGSKPEHIANNIEGCEVYQYRIDGNIIREGLRCDFMIWNEKRRDIYLIELKGSDLDHALEQLDATDIILRNQYYKDIKNCIINYRVVLNRTPNHTHSLMSNKVKKFKKNHSGSLVYKSEKLEENI